MLQDSFGQILVSTTAGIQPFDGYGFSKPSKNNIQQLADWVWQMKNRENGIWTLGSSPTIHCINGKTYRPHPANQKLLSNHKSLNQSSFQIKTGDTVNIGFTGNSYYLQLLPDSSIRKISLDGLMQVPCAYVIDADDKNNELFGGYFPEGRKGKLENIWIDGHLYPIPAQSYKKRIWVKSVTDSTTAVTIGKYAFLINRKSKQLAQTQMLASDILSLEVDHAKNIWVGHRRGVTKYNSQLDSTPFEDNDLGFVCVIMEDREHNMWFGSVKGIYKLLSPYISNFSHVENELITNEKTPLLTKVEAKIFGLSERRLYHIKDGKPAKLLSLMDYGIRGDALSRGNGTTLYIAGRRGIFKYTNGNIAQVLPRINTSNSIITEKDNSFWINHFTFFRKYDSSGVLLFDSSTLPDSVQADEKKTVCSVLCSDHEGGVWLIYNRKLTHFSNGVLNEYSKLSGHEKLHKSTDYQVINNNLWLASQIWGVYILHNDSLYNLTTEDGLASNYCNALAKESDSSIWISGSRGLQLLTYKFLGNELIAHVEIFSSNDGLPSGSAHSISKSDGSIWVSNRSGLSRFDSENFFSNRIAAKPTIRITRISVNERPTNKNELTGLTHVQNRIAVHLKAISFENLSTPGYQYRLLGSDSNWQFTTDTVVNLGPLVNGTYTFEARAITKKGLISEELVSLTIQIAPPFWRTWWFIILIILVAQSIVIGLAIFYTRLQRKALVSDKRSLQAELKAIRSQINPHFMFNALNSLQERLTDDTRELSSNHLGSFAELMRRVLWASRQARISVNDEMEIAELYLSFASSQYNEKVSYSIHVSNKVKEQGEVLLVPPLITQPLVENAVLHGASKSQHSEGFVRIEINLERSNLMIDISDNGPGFAKRPLKSSDKSRESVGSKLIMEHIDLVNQGSRQKIKYEVKRIQNETHVILIIPIDI